MINGKRGAFAINSSGRWRNNQLLKDCGIIPYLLHKNHGFRSVMVGSGNFEPEKFPYFDKYVRGLEMDFLSENTVQARLEYLIAHAAEIDLLICYGAFPQYIPIADVYKKVRPDGKIYLATDMNIDWADRIPHTNPDYEKFLKSCDVVAASCRATQKYISAKWRVPVELIRNGWYNFPQVSFSNLFEQKENIITYKDRLSRVGFELFNHLFKKYNCEIVVMSEVVSTKLDSQEIFEEIVSLLHCYSMKLYSSRRRMEKIREAINDADES